jgi:hypothetical protein
VYSLVREAYLAVRGGYHVDDLFELSGLSIMKTTELAWKQYSRLENDFLGITDYAHLTKEHLEVYSYHLLNLIIAIGIEFDSVSNTLLTTRLEKSEILDQSLTSRLIAKKRKGDFFNMKDYRESFELRFAASKQYVTAIALDLKVFPFAPANLDESLGWWNAFTSLKHDRIENFVKAATMGHALHSLSALLLVNRYLASAIETFPPYNESSLFLSNPLSTMFLERTILEEPIMTTLTISISDEEMHRLEELSKREGLTVERMVCLGVRDFIGQPDDAFRATAKRVMDKNAELYRRLS